MLICYGQFRHMCRSFNYQNLALTRIVLKLNTTGLMPIFYLIAAAKLGRRSRKMREMINEATRTIEDSQTAQALHGLLSLKSDSGPSNFPALLKAVGQHVSPGQVPSAAAGSSGEVSHTVEVSTVPPAATTVVVSATETVQPSLQIGSLRSPPATTGSQGLTNTAQQTTYKPKAGSVMDLLMQMQSQAQQAQSAGQSHTGLQQSESLGTVTGNTVMSTPKKQLLTHTVTTPTHTPLKTLLPQSAQTPLSLVTSPLTPQAIAQLVQTQAPQLPTSTTQIISSPTLAQAPSAKTPTVATILQTVKGQSNVPVQLITGSHIVQKPVEQSQQQPPLLSSPGLQMGSPPVSQSFVVSGQSLLVSPSSITTTTSSTRTDEHNKSPLKKRPYPVTSTTGCQWDQVNSPPDKIFKQEPNTNVSTAGIPVNSPAVLPAASSLLPTSVQTVDSAGRTVTLLVQSPDGIPQTITLAPQLLEKTNNSKLNELTAIVAPMLKGGGEGEPSSTIAANTSNIALNISEGFDSIFRYMKNQVEQLKIGYSSGNLTNGGDSSNEVIYLLAF